jgi:hypothetical protein
MSVYLTRRYIKLAKQIEENIERVKGEKINFSMNFIKKGVDCLNA